MILLIHSKASPADVAVMMEALKDYVKVAVDIHKGILAGGGVMHADCEARLIEAGSQQKDIWGADWYPRDKTVGFGSLINIRPRQNNLSMEIKDSKVRGDVEKIIRVLLEI